MLSCSRIQELDGGFFERFGSLLNKPQDQDVVEIPEIEEEVVEEVISKESSCNLLAEAVGLNVSIYCMNTFN